MSSSNTTVPQVGSLYWKQQGDDWVLVQVEAVAADNITFQLVDETTGAPVAQNAQTSATATIQLAPANPLFVTCPDMTSLRHLDEAALVKNLHDRWVDADRKPYTRISNILIAVNPLRYSDKPIDKTPYVHQSLDKSPPHPFHIAENAYRQMRSLKQNQSIIISGESGSGKTETSKIILDFLTERSGLVKVDDKAQACQYDHTLGDRLMETIPILESFGNAKTHRNHNSSRFGKYMRLQFSKNDGNDSVSKLQLTGASIDTYLLETSRVVQTPVGERNFHVFYELLRSGNSAQLEELKLIPSPYGQQPLDTSIDGYIAQFHYLKQSGCTTHDAIDDKANFVKLLEALKHIEIDTADLLRVVAGILHLGNISFDEVDTSEGTVAVIHEETEAMTGPLYVAADLLGLNAESLRDAMLKKKISRVANVGGGLSGRPTMQRAGSVYIVKKDLRQANYSRDTIAKNIYEQLFASLMRQCANALEFNELERDTLPYIGVLDIFGFEDFEPKNRNSLEQLMINYANETLQNMFNHCILKNEHELYQLENIYAPQNAALRFPIFKPNSEAGDFLAKSKHLVVQYEDNKDCLNLLAAKNEGMFSVIDTVGKLAGPSDRKLIDRFHTLFTQNPCFIQPHPKDLKHTFIIKHFAGPVRYNITSFLDKNNNIASPQFDDLIKGSSLSILSTTIVDRTVETSPRRGVASHQPAKVLGSVTQIFSQQMKGLVLELESTRSNFIRCIKPNTAMDPAVFDRPSVLNQLRCSGTIQACQVLQVGLPTRVTYDELLATYTNLLGEDFMEQFQEDGRLFARALCYILDFPTDDFRLGDTKLFFKTGKIHLLDTILHVSPTISTKDVGLQLRKYIAKHRWISAVTKVVVLRYAEKTFLQVQLARHVVVLQCWFRQILARKLVSAMKTHQRIAKAWGSVFTKLRIRHAFDSNLEDKLQLLKTLESHPKLPDNRQWLLKWLEPLQRSLYAKKVGRAVFTAHLCKRAFLTLFDRVRENRAVVKLQSHARRILATKKYNLMRQHFRAQVNWSNLRTWIKGRFVFCALYRRVHLRRLEVDNEAFRAEIATLKAHQAELEEVAKSAKDAQANLTADNTRLAAELAASQEITASWEAKFNDIQGRYNAAQELASAEAARASRAEAELLQVRTSSSELQTKLEMSIADASKLAQTLEQELSEAKQQILQVTEAQNVNKVTIENLHGENTKLKEENAALAERLSTLAAKLADADLERQNLKNALEQSSAEVDSLSKRVGQRSNQDDNDVHNSILQVKVIRTEEVESSPEPSPKANQSGSEDEPSRRRSRNQNRGPRKPQPPVVETLSGVPITSLHFGKRSKKVQMKEEKQRRSRSPCRPRPVLVHQSSLD
ncbi:unnamed protein product [Aphanomyces euteiches]